MYLTKLNKLIWIVVLLPCIQAQSNEFTFAVSSYDPRSYVNVTNTQEIKLMCTYPTAVVRHETISILKNNMDVVIVQMSELKKEFESRYSYRTVSTTPSRRTSELTIKYANKNDVEIYQCAAQDTYGLRLRVFYPPTQPICTSIKSNKTTTLVCESELGKPEIAMAISNSTNTYTPTSAVSNVTHTSQSVDFYGYGKNITCTTTYNFIQKDVTYTTTQSCMFDDIVADIIDVTTAITTLDLFVDNSTTIYLPSSISTINVPDVAIIKYSIVMIMVVLVDQFN